MPVDNETGQFNGIFNKLFNTARDQPDPYSGAQIIASYGAAIASSEPIADVIEDIMLGGAERGQTRKLRAAIS